MKKSFFATIFLWGLLLLSCFFLPEAAYAEDSNSIERIDMDVSIDANGTAHIKKSGRLLSTREQKATGHMEIWVPARSPIFLSVMTWETIMNCRITGIRMAFL